MVVGPADSAVVVAAANTCFSRGPHAKGSDDATLARKPSLSSLQQYGTPSGVPLDIVALCVADVLP